tara:strand:+ start:401 stop:1024 length:624 start_codon:yes stop_codon:yes gene_type:complete
MKKPKPWTEKEYERVEFHVAYWLHHNRLRGGHMRKTIPWEAKQFAAEMTGRSWDGIHKRLGKNRPSAENWVAHWSQIWEQYEARLQHGKRVREVIEKESRKQKEEETAPPSLNADAQLPITTSQRPAPYITITFSSSNPDRDDETAKIPKQWYSRLFRIRNVIEDTGELDYLAEISMRDVAMIALKEGIKSLEQKYNTKAQRLQLKF